MSSLIDSIESERLAWFPEIGLGWYPVTEAPYDAAYWQKYLEMDASDTGAALTKARVDLVRKFYTGGILLDVGIGGGRFVREIGGYGFDINPDAVNWLTNAGLYLDPEIDAVQAATFWDSLEHIHDPRQILANVAQFAFVSCPIFDGPKHVLRSKHFRRDEHCWYFTEPGLAWFMNREGFELISSNRMEVECGREDIGTFVFERRR